MLLQIDHSYNRNVKAFIEATSFIIANDNYCFDAPNEKNEKEVTICSKLINLYSYNIVNSPLHLFKKSMDNFYNGLMDDKRTDFLPIFNKHLEVVSKVSLYVDFSLLRDELLTVFDKVFVSMNNKGLKNIIANARPNLEDYNEIFLFGYRLFHNEIASDLISYGNENPILKTKQPTLPLVLPEQPQGKA